MLLTVIRHRCTFVRMYASLIVPQAARADVLHLLAAKLVTPSVEDGARSTAFAGATAVASGSQRKGGLPRAAPSPPSSHPSPPSPPPPRPSPAVDLSALGGLREFLTARLFRFLVHKDEVLLDAGSGLSAGGNDGGSRGGGVDRFGWGGLDGASRGEGKGKSRARRRRGGRFQLVPLRLLQERSAPGGRMGHGLGEDDGGVVMRSVRGRGVVVARDPIGHLLKCCWALVPALEGSAGAAGPGDDAHGRLVVSGSGKREIAEAVSRAVLGAGRRRSGEWGRLAKNGLGVCTREGEALMAVVEFLQGGGGMEVSLFGGEGELERVYIGSSVCKVHNMQLVLSMLAVQAASVGDKRARNLCVSSLPSNLAVVVLQSTLPLHWEGVFISFDLSKY